jgi:carbonic anhydrase/acetyltransferase-like protein (isoleucine patch superfamily)
MVYGSPARVVRPLTAEEQAGLPRWAEKYVAVARAHRALGARDAAAGEASRSP